MSNYHLGGRDYSFEEISERIFESVRFKYYADPEKARKAFLETLSEEELTKILARKEVVLAGIQYEGLTSLVDTDLQGLLIQESAAQFFIEASERRVVFDDALV